MICSLSPNEVVLLAALLERIHFFICVGLSAASRFSSTPTFGASKTRLD